MKRNQIFTVILIYVCLVISSIHVFAQSRDFTTVRAGVFFDRPLRDWDGFGFNYAQTAHFIDKNMNPAESKHWWDTNHPGKDSMVQEYGGFSLLDETEKAEITGLIFGENGVKPGIVKMFLGADHQKEPQGVFDHESTTNYMCEFVRRGLRKTHERGAVLHIIEPLVRIIFNLVSDLKNSL